VTNVSRPTSGAELLPWLARLPPGERDAAVEELLGIGPASDSTPPGEHLIGHHASGVAAIVRTLIEVPVVAEDVVIDLGSGLGKVVFLARLLTGATVRGVELQAGLVERARRARARLGIDVDLVEGDVRDAHIEDGTVFFLYAPFTGPVLDAVALRLKAVAQERAIVVAALGVDLGRAAPWLVPRQTDSFWLILYDGAEPGVSPRPRARTPSLGHAGRIIAFERPDSALDASDA